MENAKLNEASLIPELNAYLSTQNNDGRAANAGTTNDHMTKGDRDEGGTDGE